MTGAVPSRPLAVVIPIRGFEAGKSRLGSRLDPARRADLLRAMAEKRRGRGGGDAGGGGVERPGGAQLGRVPRLTVLDDPGTLDLAAAAGLGWAGAAGFGRVIVAHADLPLATTLAPMTADGRCPVAVAVPCHRDDGTPVLSLPTAAAGSCSPTGRVRSPPRRAAALRLAFRVRRDDRLGRDVDSPEDLVGLPLPLAAPAAPGPARGMTPSARNDPCQLSRPRPDRWRRVDLPVPARALAIGAHPDDIDFGCGGTLAKWAAAGCAVTELVLTDGSKGSWDPKADRETLVALRQEEQRSGRGALGAGRGRLPRPRRRRARVSGLAERGEVAG